MDWQDISILSQAVAITERKKDVMLESYIFSHILHKIEMFQ
jgi:hypothetical protein